MGSNGEGSGRKGSDHQLTPRKFHLVSLETRNRKALQASVPGGPSPAHAFSVSLTHLARFQAGRPEMEREKSHIESWKKYKFSGNTGNKNSAAGRGKLTKNQELIRAGPL